MENRFKKRISRIFRFRDSFRSCRTAGDLTDAVEKPLFTPPQQPQKVNGNYSRLTDDPKTLPFTSICRPKCPETTAKAISDSIFPRRKLSRRYPYHPFIPADSNRHSCPLDPFYKTPKKKNKNKNSFSRKNLFSSSSQDSSYFNENYCFSSEEGSKSTFSSDSSEFGSCRRRRRLRKGGSRRRRGETKKGEKGVIGKVEDSFAIVKRSRDPYSDFRTSMVEMIVEKQIFAAYDLEKLLQCFLSLNSDHHHRIIVEVFTEIYDVLFSNCS